MLQAIIREVGEVRDFPNRPGLSIVRLLAEGDIPSAEIVSAKLGDGTFRYAPGDWTVLLPEGGILPEWLLREMEFWSGEKGKGTLAGSRGNRLKGRTFKGEGGFEVESRGALYGEVTDRDLDAGTCLVAGEGGVTFVARLHEDVADRLGVTTP